MAKFHFVEDYERHVAALVDRLPLDEAMAQAVGGGVFDTVGGIEGSILRHAGLQNGMFVVDLGCGSGRLAVALSREFEISFTGLDIVQALLDYAKSKTPASYRYILNKQLALPVDDASADFVTAFSVFTHLLHAESYIYMEEAQRALKPGGKLVFSFIEFRQPEHWPAFEGEIVTRKSGLDAVLNTFIDRHAIRVWAAKLNFGTVDFIDALDAPFGGAPLGQSVAILTK